MYDAERMFNTSKLNQDCVNWCQIFDQRQTISLLSFFTSTVGYLHVFMYENRHWLSVIIVQVYCDLSRNDPLSCHSGRLLILRVEQGKRTYWLSTSIAKLVDGVEGLHLCHSLVNTRCRSWLMIILGG